MMILVISTLHRQRQRQRQRQPQLTTTMISEISTMDLHQLARWRLQLLPRHHPQQQRQRQRQRRLRLVPLIQSAPS